MTVGEQLQELQARLFALGVSGVSRSNDGSRLYVQVNSDLGPEAYPYTQAEIYLARALGSHAFKVTLTPRFRYTTSGGKQQTTTHGLNKLDAVADKILAWQQLQHTKMVAQEQSKQEADAQAARQRSDMLRDLGAELTTRILAPLAKQRDGEYPKSLPFKIRWAGEGRYMVGDNYITATAEQLRAILAILENKVSGDHVFGILAAEASNGSRA